MSAVGEKPGVTQPIDSTESDEVTTHDTQGTRGAGDVGENENTVTVSVTVSGTSSEGEKNAIVIGLLVDFGIVPAEGGDTSNVFNLIYELIQELKSIMAQRMAEIGLKVNEQTILIFTVTMEGADDAFEHAKKARNMAFAGAAVSLTGSAIVGAGAVKGMKAGEDSHAWATKAGAGNAAVGATSHFFDAQKDMEQAEGQHDQKAADVVAAFFTSWREALQGMDRFLGQTWGEVGQLHGQTVATEKFKIKG